MRVESKVSNCGLLFCDKEITVGQPDLDHQNKLRKYFCFLNVSSIKITNLKAQQLVEIVLSIL